MCENPKLRSLSLHWVQLEGEQILVLQDPLRLTENSLMVPRAVAPFLGLLDGTRDLSAIEASFGLLTGLSVPPGRVEALVQTLDEAFLLENQRFFNAKREAIEDYHAGPFRTPAIAGQGYPDDPTELRMSFDQYCRDAGVYGDEPADGVAGLISPHIDFKRGWRTYAEIWQQARLAVRDAELVIVLGTDHGGSAGSLTLTRQSYATPWGILPTDTELVDRLAGVLGEEQAFAEEAHHIGEHSIELAATWLHYVAGGEPKRLLPVLCGHHENALGKNYRNFQTLWDTLSVMAEVASKQRVLVVAAGDVSHMGPAFGDTLPLDDTEKASIRSTDEQWLEAACSGDSNTLTEYILQKGDRTRICGSAPIHHMATILQGSHGKVLGYEQCPADDEFGSLVSIVGALFTV